MSVLGTAGHVDHGKTSLVRALTGVDTDRLPEEQRRGITIELGFAPLRVRDGDGPERVVSIVDVPGHERFVGTMVGGAQGVDVAMLVVAADGGVMPQTREHVAVLQLLGVKSLIVALTRADLADDEVRALSILDVEDLLADTPYAGAPLVVVSAKTGDGIEALRTAIADATRPPRDGAKSARDRAPARLPIDRVFSPRGQGVVVTGTLIAGALATADELVLLPSGARVRVRGLHVHGVGVAKAGAGQRVAVALSGVSLGDVRRGETLAAIDSLSAVRVVDGVFALAGDAGRSANGGKALGRRARLSIHAGTDEVSARLIVLGALEPLHPLHPLLATKHEGNAGRASDPPRLVRMILARPVAVAVGDRLIVRADRGVATVGTTLGALEVLRVGGPRMSRARNALADDLRMFVRHGEASRALAEVDGAGLRGLSSEQLAPKLAARGLDAATLRALAPLELRAPGASAGRRWIGMKSRAKAIALVVAAIERHHREHAEDEGAPIATALSALPANAARGLAEVALDAAIAAGTVVRAVDRVRLSSFTPRASASDRAALALAAALDSHGLTPPMLDELSTTLGHSSARGRALATSLANAGRVVHVKDDLWMSRTAVDALRVRLVTHLEAHGSITTQAFKDLVGASRKYVMPLVEWFDDQRITLRVGDVRKLRG